MVMDIAAAERREKRGKSHNSNFVFAKSRVKSEAFIEGEIRVNNLVVS